MNQLISLVDPSITGNRKTKGLSILIQGLNTSQKDYVSHCLVTIHRGLYLRKGLQTSKWTQIKTKRPNEKSNLWRDVIENRREPSSFLRTLDRLHSFIYSSIHLFIHSFILETYIAPLQDTTTQRHSQPSHGQRRKKIYPTHTAHQLKAFATTAQVTRSVYIYACIYTHTDLCMIWQDIVSILQAYLKQSLLRLTN